MWDVPDRDDVGIMHEGGYIHIILFQILRCPLSIIDVSSIFGIFNIWTWFSFIADMIHIQ